MKLYEKFQAVVAELDAAFYERYDLFYLIALGMLSDNNVYALGPPGTAKSMGIRAWAERVVGGSVFNILLDRQLPLESVFGPIDPLGLRAGEFRRKVEGFLPTAHFAFLDEIGKAGPATLNPLLTVLLEHLYKNGVVELECPLLVAVGASNEELEEELAALWDRWMFRIQIDYIQDPSSFASLITQGVTPTANPTTLTIDEVLQAREEVKAVKISPGIAEKLVDLKEDLHREQCNPSDRRWLRAATALKAAAWFNGRSEVDEDDIAVLRFTHWDVVEQIPKVEELVLKHSSETAAKAIEFERELDELEEKLNSLKGLSDEEISKVAGPLNKKVQNIQADIANLVQEEADKGKTSARLTQVQGRAKALRRRVLTEGLGLPESKVDNIL